VAVTGIPREEEKVQEYSYGELSNVGLNTASLGSVIDPDSPEFIKPESMVCAIADYCQSTGKLSLRALANLSVQYWRVWHWLTVIL